MLRKKLALRYHKLRNLYSYVNIILCKDILTKIYLHCCPLNAIYNVYRMRTGLNNK